MAHDSPLSAETLGQIALIQSMVAHLPDKENMLHFVCRGLTEVPGVSNVDCHVADDAAPLSTESQESLRAFLIKSEDVTHGEIRVHISDDASFAPYIPFIENLTNMLAVILEERRQKDLNRSIMAELEERVFERTRKLEAEIAERKQAKAALLESEMWFRTIFENSRDAIGVSKTGIHTLANKSYLNMFGYDHQEELVNTSILNLIAPDERPTIIKNVQNRSSGNAPTHYETRGLKKDGTEFDMEVVASSFVLNEELFTLVILRDITERKQAELALHTAERRYRDIFEKAPVMSVITSNQAGTPIIADYNQLFASALGYSQTELIGKPLSDIYIPESRVKLEEGGYQRALDNRFTVEERDLLTHDGRVIKTLLQAVPEIDAAGQVFGTLAMYVDITERKQAEAALLESESALAKAQQVARIGSWSWDVTKDIIRWSDEMYRLYGLPHSDEPTIEAVRSLIHPDDVGIFDEAIQHAPEGKSFIDYRIIMADGTEKWLQAVATARYDSGGTLTEMTGTVQDITQRKQTELALRESEKLMRTLAENYPSYLSIIHKDLTVGFTGGQEFKRRNLDPKQFEGLTLEQVFGEHAPFVAEQYQKAFEGQTTVFELTIGNQHQLYQAVPLPDEDGHINRILTVVTNETERKLAEQERLKLKKLESVGVLAGGIAHDFNNLLTGLFGNIELAKMFLPADHKSYKLLEAAGRSMENATKLTQQLLTFAKGGDPIKETLSIGEVMTEAAQFSLRGSNVKLQTGIAPDLWLVEADKGQISQVISNLVINAQQAMPTGGTITLTAENVETAEGRHVKITVQDEGVGVAPQHVDKIFDPYFSTKQTGSGLGLAVIHSIITKHNGRITVDSELNRGTVFTILLEAIEKPAGNITGESLTDTQAAPIHSARILVLEDKEIVRDVVDAMLKEMGHRISFAINGQEAIAKYRAAYEDGTPYDTVIADLTIPGGMGGQKTAQEILKIDPQAKLIVSSGYATDPVMAHYQDYGFKGMVIKPYHFNDLRSEIQRVLNM